MTIEFKNDKARDTYPQCKEALKDAVYWCSKWAEQRKLPFTVALDSAGDIARQFGDVTLTPTTFLIDKQGRIIKTYVGAPDFGAVHKLIEKEL